MNVHELKTWPEYYRAIADRTKTFEVRVDDGRGFAVGDALELCEYSKSFGYTGRSLRRKVTYILKLEDLTGVHGQWVVMAIE